MGGGSIRVALIVFGDNLVELLEKHALVVVGLVVHVQRVEHFQNFLVIDVVACQARQLLEIAYFGSHQFHKLFEVDWFVLDSESIDDVVDKGTLSSLSQLLHDFADFLRVDGAGMVDVE